MNPLKPESETKPQMSDKRPYAPPAIRVAGTIADLTEGGSAGNNDFPAAGS